jgi:ABC-type multidrug transport system fused ATPase/permease subunit
MRWWRGQLATVAQHSHLFHGTVADNIRIGNPEASIADIQNAAELAMADEYIHEFQRVMIRF